MQGFARARDITRETSSLLLPRDKRKPTDVARKVANDRGTWSPELAPYVCEPLDLLPSRQYQVIDFVGPARTSKTFSFVLAASAYVSVCERGDSLIIGMSRDTIRDFSQTELDRTIRHSPEWDARLSKRSRDDNTFDKMFLSGQRLKLGWPAVSQLSSKTLQFVFATDYDRPENRDNVDGEGPMWKLMQKRTTTYLSRGKCIVESSPDAEVIDPSWVRPVGSHEAPPVNGGVLTIYNEGTRAWWYWKCQGCGEYFAAMPGLDNFDLPAFDELCQLVANTDDLETLAEQFAHMPCRRAGCGVSHSFSDRAAMQASGRWVHEGEKIDRDGNITGTRRNTKVASFWLGGVAACFQTWQSLLSAYFNAVKVFVSTGDEAPLKYTVNTDQGAAYTPRALMRKRSADTLRRRAENEDWPRGKIPDGVRFLVSCADVQKHKFIVQTFGFGTDCEWWLIDRFAITASPTRMEGERNAAIDPAGFVEDWSVITDEILLRKYEWANGLYVPKTPELVVVDSGGEDGVTSNAYAFWRSLPEDLKKGVALVKGSNIKTAPRVAMHMPEAKHKGDRAEGARGDVPVWFINTDALKDTVSTALARELPGPNYLHVPQWVAADPALSVFFDEMNAETRVPGKGWQNPHKRRNEAFDLAVYARAAVLMMNAEGPLFWNNPPPWTMPKLIAPQGKDALLAKRAEERNEPAPEPEDDDPFAAFRELARNLNG